MKNRESAPKIQPRLLILFLIIGLLPLITGSLLLIYGARQIHREAIGDQVSDIADYAQVAVSHYLQQMIVQTAGLTAVPEVLETVQRANQTAALSRPVAETEAGWSELTLENSPLLQALLNNPAAEFLRDYQKIAPAFREILVTDREGRLVTATNKPSDYYQADERWWQFGYREGTGGHFISDIQFDESARVYALEVAQPVMDETGSCIGVLKVILDSQDLFSLVNAVQAGQTGHATLLRGDGTVLVSRRHTIADQQRYDLFDEIEGSLRAKRSYTQVGSAGEQMLIGFAGTNFEETYPELKWHLLIQEPSAEAFAPFEALDTRFLVIVIFSVALAVVLAYFFSRLLAKPAIQTDPHLEKL